MSDIQYALSGILSLHIVIAKYFSQIGYLTENYVINLQSDCWLIFTHDHVQY